MDMDAAIKSGNIALAQDPRQARYGYYVGSSFVMASVRVFKWFSSVQDLVEHLINVEPVVFELSAEDADRIRKELLDVLNRFDVQDLTSKNLALVNSKVKDFLVVDWWGTFDELTTGSQDFSESMRENFRGGEFDSDSKAIADDELDQFIEYIKDCGV